MSKQIDQEQNKRLFDLLFRHQIYLEGVKDGLSADFVAMLSNLFTEFAKYIGQMPYATMDEFSKAELSKFVGKFLASQSEAFGQYISDLMLLLEEFLAADIEVTNAIAEDIDGVAPEDQDESKLWAAILAEPISANGELIKPYITRFYNSALLGVTALVRMGYANGWTAFQLQQALTGESQTLFRNGLFSKLASQNSSLVNTVMQQISSGTQAAVFSGIYERYQWVAILDNRTTVICRSRNGTIYIYGQGPLPPAHYNCRSKAVPITGETQSHSIPESYWEWISQQPEAFQNDVLGLSTATKLRAGDLKASDFTSISTNEPLTISEFASKIKYILAI
jgi:SPP1 gp7 family putative phage head morphogenesis protein